MALYVIGVDPAARNDYLALALLRCEAATDGAATAAVLKVDRIRGIDLDEIMPAVMSVVVGSLDLLAKDDRLALVVDGTGIGAQPCEQIVKELRRLGLSSRVLFKAVTLSGGSDEHRKSSWRVSVPRTSVTDGFVIDMGTGLINARALTGEAAKMLRREVTDWKHKRTAAGKVRVDHPTGGHDDVIFAVALAWWLGSWKAKATVSGTGVARAFGLIRGSLPAKAPKPSPVTKPAPVPATTRAERRTGQPTKPAKTQADYLNVPIGFANGRSPEGIKAAFAQEAAARERRAPAEGVAVRNRAGIVVPWRRG